MIYNYLCDVANNFGFDMKDKHRRTQVILKLNYLQLPFIKKQHHLAACFV
jgi:hypothetical protein